MSDTTGELMRRTAAQIFQDQVNPEVLRAAEVGTFAGACWDAVAEAGLHHALVPESAGGFGVPVTDALALLRVAGEYAVPLPLAETMLGTWLLAGAGIAIPEGRLAIGYAPEARFDRLPGSWHATGRLDQVAWGRDADALVLLGSAEGTQVVALLHRGEFAATPGENMAREPRDSVHFDIALPPGRVEPAAPGIGALQFRAAGAVSRALLMAGALARVSAMTTQYAQDRVQFGKPLGKQQAIQQSLAILASQAAAAGVAADLGAECFADGLRLPGIATAKIRTGEAAGIANGLAHQIHGAIGFTYEHSLHFSTKRLWSWRNEYGTETEWSILLGRHLAAAGSARLWSEITAA